MKKCRRCEQIKPVTEYHNAPRAGDGLQSYCKPCSLEMTNESKIRIGERWYHRDGYATEWEHFNAALECYSKIFDMPRLTRYKVSGSIKSSDLKYKP